jgi:hypothetical protein
MLAKPAYLRGSSSLRKEKKLARKACLPQAGREDAKGFSLRLGAK